MTRRGARATIAVIEADSPTLLEALYERNYLAFVRLAVVLVDSRASAEEVVQDAFVRALRSWDSLRDVDSAEAYIRRAVVNGCRDRLRRRRTRRLAILPMLRPHPSAEETVLGSAEHREVIDAINDLPRRQREVLVLRYFSELSEAEIAHAMGISTGTVKSTAHRALSTLRNQLEAGRNP